MEQAVNLIYSSKSHSHGRVNMSSYKCVQLRPPVLVILGFLIPWTQRHFLLSKAKSPDEPVSHAVESYLVGLLIISVAEKNSTKGQRAELLQLPCQVCVLTQHILQTPGLPTFFLVFLLWTVQCAHRCAWGLRWSRLSGALRKKTELLQIVAGIYLFVLGIPKDKDFEMEDGTLSNLNWKA